MSTIKSVRGHHPVSYLSLCVLSNRRHCSTGGALEFGPAAPGHPRYLRIPRGEQQREGPWARNVGEERPLFQKGVVFFDCPDSQSVHCCLSPCFFWTVWRRQHPFPNSEAQNIVCRNHCVCRKTIRPLNYLQNKIKKVINVISSFYPNINRIPQHIATYLSRFLSLWSKHIYICDARWYDRAIATFHGKMNQP